MSFNDFFITTSSDNQVSQPTGSAYLNSLIASYTTPLTSSTLCRSFNELGLSNQATRASFFVSSSFSSEQCVNIPDTKSVSIRLWARNYSYGGGGRVVLNAKHSPYNSYFNTNDNSENSKSGYEFSYSVGVDGGSGWPYYKFEFAAGGYQANMSNITLGADPRGTLLNPYTTPSTSVDWVGLRMDIVPVKIPALIDNISQYILLKDIVTLYTASASEPSNWIESYRTEILTSDSRFVPWGNYTSLSNSQERAGLPVLTSSYGFSIRGGIYAESRTFIDDFKMYVRNAF